MNKNSEVTERILILLDEDFIGVAEINYRYILPEFINRNWNAIFLSSGEENIKNYFGGLGIDVNVVPALKPYKPFSKKGRLSIVNIIVSYITLLKNRKILKTIINHYYPKAIISNSMISHLLLGLLRNIVSNGERVLTVMHLQDIVDRSKALGFYGLGLDWIAANVNKIITISDAVSDTLSKRFHKKIIKLYNPVYNEMPSKVKIQNAIFRVGMFARYIPWKGHKDLIRIANFCNNKNIEFISFGNFSHEEIGYYEELRAQATNLPKSAKVKFNTFIAEVYNEMAKCDLILHLSTLPEPFGRVLIEANACKVPVFAYKGGGAEELYNELGLAGKLFENGDWKSVGRAICDFKATEYKFPDMSKLSPSAYVDRFLSVITEN